MRKIIDQVVHGDHGHDEWDDLAAAFDPFY